eukprot:60811-Chlamydomonas_euryale.AAC.13
MRGVGLGTWVDFAGNSACCWPAWLAAAENPGVQLAAGVLADGRCRLALGGTLGCPVGELGKSCVAICACGVGRQLCT